MDKYDLLSLEESINRFWEKEKIYSFNPRSKAKIYSIDTPPPTLSGEMHIGHAFSYAQQDFIIRYQRMKGLNVFYPFGTDDNGLPTERLVERNKGIKSKEMSRSDFVKLCMNFLKEKRPHFILDWKKIGISCDWDLIYSTIDDHSRKISQWSFLDLYHKGRVYRKDSPSMWCPDCKTGVAQMEIQDKEIDSSFNWIVFNVDGKSLEIATTRPELLPACVAVLYNPKDNRFKKFKNKKAIVPLFDFEVPVIEDHRVNPEKGTGIVMCCTFGDQTDIEWQKAYDLPIKISVTSDGKMTELAGKYKDMSLKEARKKIVEDLKNSGLLVKEEPIKHFVNVHERCGTEIEFIKTKQWFVKYLDLKKKMLEWGRELKWYPDFMRHRYENWVKGLQWDWLISNQRHFGVSFPVWYCKNCEEVILAGENQLPVDPLKNKPDVKECPKCKSKEFIPEPDVLNTWFTSSMTPQIGIGLVDKSSQQKLFPMNLRPQAHEIISFWLFNTLVKSRLHFNKNPWKEVVISGFATLGKQKMSKSKGKVIRPQEIIEKYGADSIRYWAASSKLGEDLEYREKDVLTGKKFIIKLLNVSNFVFMNLKEKPKTFKLSNLHDTDKLFLSQLNKVIEESTKSFENYNYSRSKSSSDNFFWKVFADNYLEIIKDRVYNGNEIEKKSAFYTLYNSLFTILKLISPFTPYVTEEIYQKYFRKDEKYKSIHISTWPDKFNLKTSDDEDKVFNLLLEIIYKVRQEKTLAKKSMNSEIILTLDTDSFKKFESKKPLLKDLQSVTKSKEIKKGDFSVEFC